MHCPLSNECRAGWHPARRLPTAAGRLTIMHTELHWVEAPSPVRLAISARPRGGDWLEDEMRGWQDAGVNVVVSLLTPSEAADLDLAAEQKVCRDYGLKFTNLPIEDRGIPGSEIDAIRVIESIASDLSRGKRVVIHCRQGIGRAGMIAASVLVEKGWKPAEAVARVSRDRRVPVPETPGQRAWIERFATKLTSVTPAEARESSR
jgi:protein-tyrosine phosphatase